MDESRAMNAEPLWWAVARSEEVTRAKPCYGAMQKAHRARSKIAVRIAAPRFRWGASLAME
jgi:hypothetical protein